MWTVRECNNCGERDYLYGEDDQDFQCSKCGKTNYNIVPKENWNSEDIAIIAGDELEDGNYHEITDMPENLVAILKKNKIREDKARKIIKEFVDNLWHNL